MYAIFEAKGKQFRAEPDATLRMPTLDAEPGDRVTFDHVLLAERDDEIIVGQPSLDGAAVAAEVIRHGRDDKIIVYKMKRRKGYRRKQGHRQGFTEVRVLDIDFGKGKSVARKAEAAPKAAAKKAAAKPVAEKRGRSGSEEGCHAEGRREAGRGRVRYHGFGARDGGRGRSRPFDGRGHGQGRPHSEERCSEGHQGT